MSQVAIANCNSYDRQTVEEGLDELFAGLGMSVENPFGGIIQPGQNVFIKPNWVAHQFRTSCQQQDSLWSTITHPAVIEAVASRVARALRGAGRIVIGDNPSIDCDFDQLIENSNLADLPNRLDVETKLIDLRPLICADLADYGLRDKMVPQEGDPLGATAINLGTESLFYGMDPDRFRGVFTDRRETIAAHTGEQHLYEISSSIATSDVYISLPKLKTHHKVGTTLNLKGLVGTVANKNLLVHWRTGFPEVGGDEYPDRATWESMQGVPIQKRGAWPGNDTIWRMVVDLEKCLHRLRRNRPEFTIIDGVIGGQGEGPFCPQSKQSGVLIGSNSLIAADIVATRLMGFDVDLIPYLRYYVQSGTVTPAEFRVHGIDWLALLGSQDRGLDFRPPESWRTTMVGS